MLASLTLFNTNQISFYIIAHCSVAWVSFIQTRGINPYAILYQYWWCVCQYQ